MRVIVAFPDDGETGQAILDGCRSNGYETDFVCAQKYPFQILSLLSKKTYDVVICSRTIGLLPTIVRAKNRYPDVKFCVWNVDERANIGVWGLLLSLFHLVDYLFVVSEGHLNKWQYVNKNVHFLAQGVQIERYHKPTLTDADRIKYMTNVSFIGNVTKYHTDRIELLEYINEHFDFKTFEVYGEDHNKACAVSKINIGMAHSPWLAKYHSVRDWKILASGGVLLTRWHPGYDELFPGVETFKSKEDCACKIQMILNDYPTYRDKAEKLCEWACTTQRYADRIKQMMEIMND